MQTTALDRQDRIEPAIAAGMWIGLWIGEVITATHYWLARFGRRFVLAGSCLSLGAAAALAYYSTTTTWSATERIAGIELKALANSVQSYRMGTGRFPSRLEELVPKYLSTLSRDPWGKPYALYRGEGGLAIVSAGPDGSLGTADDLIIIDSERGSRGQEIVDSQRFRLQRVRLRPELDGIRVVEADADSYLAGMGLRAGDVILKVDGQPQGTLEPLAFWYPRPAGMSRLDLEIERAGKRMQLSFEWMDGVGFRPVDRRERGKQ